MTLLYQNISDSRVVIRDLLVFDPQKGNYFPLEFGPYEVKDLALLGVDELQLKKSSGWKYFTSLCTIEKVIPIPQKVAEPITVLASSEENVAVDTNSDNKADAKKRQKRR